MLHHCINANRLRKYDTHFFTVDMSRRGNRRCLSFACSPSQRSNQRLRKSVFAVHLAAGLNAPLRALSAKTIDSSPCSSPVSWRAKDLSDAEVKEWTRASAFAICREKYNCVISDRWRKSLGELAATIRTRFPLPVSRRGMANALSVVAKVNSSTYGHALRAFLDRSQLDLMNDLFLTYFPTLLAEF